MSLRPAAMRADGGLLSALARRSVRVRADLPLVVLDGILAVAAYGSLLALLAARDVVEGTASNARAFVALAVAVHLIANWAWGLYGEVWKHAGVQEARRICLAGLTPVAVLLPLALLWHLPGPAVLLGAGATLMFIGVLRFQSRLFAFRTRADLARSTRVVVLGAGESGAALVRDMLEPGGDLHPVAILDDDPRKQGRSLHGVPVIGGLDRLDEAVARHGAEVAVLAIPSADGELVRSCAATADDAGVTLKVLPRVSEMVRARISMRDVRELRIDDLLGRSQVHTDLAAVAGILTGRRVLITGAGGSIGSEITRQVAACGPARLLLLDHDETHLHDVATSLGAPCVQLLADIRDAAIVDDILAAHRPDVIFHAAAHKHVPLLEEHPCEAVRTNVLGTANVLHAALRHATDRFVLISTDKAVRPTSIMGASKRVAEQLVLSHGAGRYCAVRFGNVLGSRGSVIPLFARQIEQGGPVTVTDPRMSRFFMSIPEAVQLVLQAAAFAQGGEVFMLDMGQPVRIFELAERMIRLSGRRVGVDVPIRIVGTRPGEKIAEELRLPEEAPIPTPHPAIHALHPPVLDRAALDAGLAELRAIVASNDNNGATRALVRLATADATVVRLPGNGHPTTVEATRVSD